MTRYAVTSTAVWYRAGILKRTQRHARLSRIQAVNVSYSLLGRLIGLGFLDIEVAGGADSSIKLGLLRARRLEELRALLLALASGAIDEAVDPNADAVASTVGRRSGTSPAGGSRASRLSDRWRQASGFHAGDRSTMPWRCFSVSSCSA